MNIWLVIAIAGIGTYLMRSTGVWMSPNLVPTRWLTHLPLAVILVLTVTSLSGLSDSGQQTLAVLAASVVVVATNLKKLPLVVSIAVGCGVYGAIAPL